MGLLKNLYTRTHWVDNKTMVNAERLNNIERGISGLYGSALTASDFEAGRGVNVETTDSGKVKISTTMTVEIITELQDSYDPNIIYFYVNNNGVLKKIIINGIASSYGVEL